jgi:hypothetical protein
MDSRIDLQQPVLDGGIRSINFFNGRLLSARDLTREQTAYREADRRLSQAVGDGIAYGLEVSKTPGASNASPAVSVAAGLAINRRGQTLMLAANTDVALVRSPEGNGGADSFSDCLPLQTGAYVAGAGAYLLTLAPAQSTEGRATTNGMNPAGSCNTDTIVTAVQFRLIQIDPPITDAELQDQNHLRNLIAYKCFGWSETNDFIKDPFGTEVNQWGLLDSLRPNQLTDCEVPLAVLYWTQNDGIKFVDMWSVRRRISVPGYSSSWSSLIQDRRLAEAEAMFLQFQAQLDTLRFTTNNPDQTRLVDQCRYVPAAGFVPLAQDNFTEGFHPDLFFDTLTLHTDVYIEGARVEQLLRASFNYPPVDLQAPDGPVMLWIYKVRENRQADGVQPYFIFSSGHMPYLADPHFDVNRWEYSNYP